jgi:hypothetical protein
MLGRLFAPAPPAVDGCLTLYQSSLNPVLDSDTCSASASLLAPSKNSRDFDALPAPKVPLVFSFWGESPIFYPPAAIAFLELVAAAAKDLPTIRSVLCHLQGLVPHSPVPADVHEDVPKASMDIQRLLIASWSHDALKAPNGVAEHCDDKIASALLVTKPDIARVWRCGLLEGPLLMAGEAKRLHTSPLEAVPQAFVAAAAGAIQLQRLGLSPAEAWVPFHTYNGLLEQHGVAYVLENGLPCLALVSSPLDLASDEGARRAAELRLAVCARTAALIAALNDFDPTTIEAKMVRNAMKMRYSLADFFCKTPASLMRSGEQAAIYQLRIFERLRAGRVPAALPVARLAYKQDANGATVLTQSRLLFEHLVKQGYVAGLPPNKDLFMPWLKAVREAVLATHKAGVVHLDLHPGNVVWRMQHEELQVRLIDFDASVLIEDKVGKTVLEHVQRGTWAEGCPSYLKADEPPSPLVDAYMLTAILLAHLAGLDEEWRAAARGDPNVGAAVALDGLCRLVRDNREILEGCCRVLLEGGVDATKAALQQKVKNLVVDQDVQAAQEGLAQLSVETTWPENTQAPPLDL